MKIHSVIMKTIFDWRKSLFFFSLGLFLLGILYASIFPSIAQTGELVDALEGLPDAFQNLVGDVSLFNTPNGFLAGEYYSFTLPIVFIVLAITMGSAMLSKEEESGTIELLLSRPVSRLNIYTQKFVVLLSAPLLLGVFTVLGLWLGKLVVPEFDISMGRIIAGTGSAVVLAWAFGALTYAITTIRSRRGLAAGIASIYLIAGFIVGTFAESVSWLEPFRWVSLFEAYTAQDIILSGSGYAQIITLLVATVVFYAVGAWFFERKDIGE